MDVRVLSLQFDAPNAEFDLKDAVCKAPTDYCKTPEGRKVYGYNCANFNWADFSMSVHREFCEKYDFKRIDSAISDIEVGWDEQLVNNSHMR